MLRTLERAVASVALIVVLTYIVMANSALAYPGVQVTPPQNLSWYPVAAFGDNRPEDTASTNLPSIYYQLVNEVETTRPFALLGTGDHVGSGRLDQIIIFLNTLANVENVLVIEGNHDVGPAHNYWLEEVAPRMYYWDGLPGWRIVLFSTEVSRAEYDSLKLFLDTALNTTRHVILVFHRPAYPDVGYNMDPSMKIILMNQIRKHGNVVLALQGHWHGYAEDYVNDTLFIITGGAGAPLYQSGGKNQYLYIVLEPSGDYRVIPVALGPGSGSVEVTRIGSNVVVKNTKVSINGSPVNVPIRVRLPLDGVDAYAVLMAPHGTTVLKAEMSGNELVARINATVRWYIYYETPRGAIVNSTSNEQVLTLPAPSSTGYATVTVTTHNLIEETVTVTLPRTTTKTETTTATETVTETTTETLTKAVTETLTVTTTHTETETSAASSPFATELGIAIVVGAASALITYALAKRR